MEGMPAKFSCEFKSDLGFRVHWARSVGNDLENFDKANQDNFIVLKPSDNVVMTDDSLIIKHVTPEDAGIYFCAAKTNSEMAHAMFNLEVLDRDKVTFYFATF